MSKLKNERAEVKAEGASKKLQKRYAPAVRRWNDRMRKLYEAHAAITKMMDAYSSTKDLV